MYAIISKKLKLSHIFSSVCLSLLFLINLTSCVSTSNAVANAPLWVTDPTAVYSDRDYLSAVGYAPDRMSAETEAVATLSRTIRQRVQAESSASQSFDTDSNGVDREFTANIQTSSVIEEISGIKNQEVWTAQNGTVYALALINREEVGRYYNGKIRDYEAAITSFISFTADNPASFEGLGALEKALDLASENELNLDILSVINPNLYKVINLSYKSAQTIEALIQNEKEKIYIGIFVDGDANNRIVAALSTVLNQAGFKTQQISQILDGVEMSMPYILSATLSIEPFEMTSNSDNKYVRFILDTQLIDENGKITLPWSISGREAHYSQTEASQRAIRTVEAEIKKSYLKEALKLLN